jgi:hypothetical protein
MEAQLKSTAALFSLANWRLIAYWTFTLFIAYENLAGSIWSFLRIEYVRVDLTQLGYPQYFLNILGPGELCIAVALLVPRFPVVKEWAYAGASLNYSAALASHLFLGDRSGIWMLAPIFLVLAVASWGLRPADRRTQTAPRVGETRAMARLVPIILLVIFAVVALFTLPKAPPHF